MTEGESTAPEGRVSAGADHRRVVGLVLVAGTAAALAIAVAGLPHDPALPLVARQALSDTLPLWHTTEPVNVVVYGTRGFDTFGETFILLGAVLGVVSVTRSRERRRWFLQEERTAAREQAESDPGRGRGRSDAGDDPADRADRAERAGVGDDGGDEPGDDPRSDGPDETAPGAGEGIGIPGPVEGPRMTVVVRGAARTVLPLLLIAGFYLVAWGYTPGGGFPGGLVVAGAIILAYTAFGHRAVRRVVRPALLEAVEMGGAALILAIELGGLIAKRSFSANWLPLGKAQTITGGGILQPFSGAELIEVATGITLIAFALLGMRDEWTDERDREAGDDAGPA